MVFPAALPAQVALPQFAKAAPSNRVPAGVAGETYPKPGAPNGGCQGGVLANSGSHCIDPADPLEIAVPQQHRLADADADADTVDGNEPPRPAAIEERGFEFGDEPA